MIVISDELVATTPTTLSSGGVLLTLNNPVIGYDNLVTIANIVADTEDLAFPALNVANQFTWSRWHGLVSASYQHLTVTIETIQEIDYLAIAGHNFDTAEIAVSVEGYTTLGSDENPDWFDLSAEIMPADNDAILFRFTRQSLAGIRLRMAPGNAAPRLAVMFVGTLLVLERRLYVGHRILNFNSKTEVLTGRSETGQYLGRSVLREANESSIDMKNLTPAFFRTDLNPFRKYAKTGAFFFAWRPDTYRFEVGYAWATGDMSVSNSLANGLMQASLAIQGFFDTGEL